MIRSMMCLLVVCSIATAAEAQYGRPNPMQQRIWQNIQVRKAQAEQERQFQAYQASQQQAWAQMHQQALAEKRRRDADPKYKAAQEQKEVAAIGIGVVALGGLAWLWSNVPASQANYDTGSEEFFKARMQERREEERQEALRVASPF